MLEELLRDDDDDYEKEEALPFGPVLVKEGPPLVVLAGEEAAPIEVRTSESASISTSL